MRELINALFPLRHHWRETSDVKFFSTLSLRENAENGEKYSKHTSNYNLYISPNYKDVCTCVCRLYKSIVLKLGGWNFACGLYSSWVSHKVWEVWHGTLRWASEADGPRRVRPASGTSEAIEGEVLLKVWDVLHPRAVGSRRAKRAYRRRPHSSCRRQRIASM